MRINQVECWLETHLKHPIGLIKDKGIYIL